MNKSYYISTSIEKSIKPIEDEVKKQGMQLRSNDYIKEIITEHSNGVNPKQIHYVMFGIKWDEC